MRFGFGFDGSSRLLLDFGRVVNQQGLDRQTFGQNHVANIVPTNRQMVHGDGLPALHSQLHCLEVDIHIYVDSFCGGGLCHRKYR